MTLLSAYLLVSHGSRDPRPQAAVEKLAQLLSDKIQRLTQPPLPSNLSWFYPVNCLPLTPAQGKANSYPASVLTALKKPAPAQPLIGTACLELTPVPLHEQISQFATQAIAAGYSRLQVLPLFLLPGVHVMEDIPAEVALATQAVQSLPRQPGEQPLTIELCSHLGQHPELTRLLATHTTSLAGDHWILLSHGSRRDGGNRPVEAIADQLGATPAYWSVPPSLETQVVALVKAGYQRIGIMPYFLFAGTLTDAIAQSVAQLAEQFPQVTLELASPLEANAALVDFIFDLAIAA